MKKIIVSIFICLATFSVFAADWNFFAPIGISVPISYFRQEKTHRNVDQRAFDLDLSLIGIEMNYGFSFEAAIRGGIGSTTCLYADDKRDFAFDGAINLGVGWSPIRKNKFILSVFARMGLNFDRYSSKKTYRISTNKEHTFEQVVTLVDFNLGFDVQASFFFNDFIGLFIRGSYDRVIVGSVHYSENEGTKTYYYNGYEYKYGSNNLAQFKTVGNQIITPTVGVVIKF